MRKLISVLLSMALILTPVTAIGEESIPSAPLIICTTEQVCGLDITYLVLTKDVVDITVTFREDIKFAEYNYVDGRLLFSIASAYPIDMSSALAQITATLSDGSKVAPELVMETLLVDGKEQTYEPSLQEITATVEEDTVEVELTAEGFEEENCRFLAAAYDADRRLISVSIVEIPASAEAQTISLLIEGTEGCVEIRLFVLDETNAPVVNSFSIFMDQLQ